MATTTDTIVEIPLGKLLPSAYNPPGRDADVAELADSIRSVGIIEPLVVVGNGKGTFHIVAGHRRRAGAELAGKTTAPCIVRDYDETQLLTAMLVENLHRKDLLPLEEAEALGRLQALPTKPSTRDIARWIGKSQPHVVKRLALLKLSAKAREHYAAGKIPTDDAVTLAGLEPAHQERVLSETTWGSMQQRIQELDWRDKEAARRAEEAKKPKPKPAPAAHTAARGIKKANQAELEKARQLRQEAADARAKVLPRLLSRGALELQYAAAVLVNEGEFGMNTEGAAQLLKLKVQKHDPTRALLEKAAKSKKAAIEVLLGLAIATVEGDLQDEYGNGDPEVAKLHIGRLQKVGYKPTELDLELLKGKRR